MTDEGDGLREPPGTGPRGRHAQASGGRRADTGAANAEGARMNGSSPHESARAVGTGGSPGAYGPGAPVPPARNPGPDSDRVPPAGAGAEDGPGQPGEPAQGPDKKKGRSFWRELPVLIVVALILTLVIKTYAIQAFYIPSGSMQNTLAIGDRVLVNKLVYDVRSIHRGDIVVFSGNGSWNPGSPPPSTNFFAKFGNSVTSMFGLSQGQNDYIKRVIGLPGDQVACCDAEGQVTVNGVPLTEQSYLYPGNPPSETRFSITVPAGRLWVMGDHRDVSYDSRGHVGDPGGGTVPESAVVGRAFIVIWPLSQFHVLSIPSTFQQPMLNSSMGSARSAQEAAAVADAGVPVHQASPALPVGLGLAGAVPLTWLQRRVRLSVRRRPRRR
jgi:signal peptidase I